jgi:hypothetical protein
MDVHRVYICGDEFGGNGFHVGDEPVVTFLHTHTHTHTHTQSFVDE